MTTQTYTQASLQIAEALIQARAAMDGDTDYDCVRDPEGYVTSILLAMRHWCYATNVRWRNELTTAGALFLLDIEEGVKATQR